MLGLPAWFVRNTVNDFPFHLCCLGPRTNALSAGWYSVDLTMHMPSSLTCNYLFLGVWWGFFGSWNVFLEPRSDSGEIVSTIYKPPILRLGRTGLVGCREEHDLILITDVLISLCQRS